MPSKDFNCMSAYKEQVGCVQSFKELYRISDLTEIDVVDGFFADKKKESNIRTAYVSR